ncbi:MAG: GDP-mannose 4,6-dehydratase [Pseudomonadota bacterium]
MHKIVVIGSNCFSGSHFVNMAIEQGSDVIGISRSCEPASVFLPYKWKDRPGLGNFKFFQYDINHDIEKIIDVIKDQQPEYVVNFAAQGMVSESWNNPDQWFQTNTLSVARLIKCLCELSFLKKYVQVSTPEVYGSNNGSIVENINYCPSTPYAVSKAAADMTLTAYYHTYGFPVVFTRAANVFGPGQQLYRIIPRTILYCFLGKQLPLHGGGYSIRSFIHIKDVINGTIKAMLNAEPGEIFHFSTLETITIRDLIKKIAKMMAVSFEDLVVESGERAGKDQAYILDCSKAEHKLDWKPNIGLEQGIVETIKWVSDNLDELKKIPFDYVHKK